MSWHYLPELVEDFTAPLRSAGVRFAPWRRCVKAVRDLSPRMAQSLKIFGRHDCGAAGDLRVEAVSEAGSGEGPPPTQRVEQSQADAEIQR